MSSQTVVLPGATYLSIRDGSALTQTARWELPGEGRRVLRVRFTAPPPGQDAFWNSARDALDAWKLVASPYFHFVFVGETDPADVDFLWVNRFAAPQAGATRRQIGPDGRIESVRVEMARFHANGSPMSDEFRRLVALHEVGHVLGLPHSESPGDVMHPGNRNLVLSQRDRHSLRALYDAP